MTDLKKFIGLIIVIGLLMTGCSDSSEEWKETASSYTTVETTQSIQTEQTVVVHVSGCVKNPGIYILSSNERYSDAIKAAGGATKDANVDAINLAKKVIDEEKIYIPSIDEKYTQPIPIVEQTNEKKTNNQLVNINTADSKTLQSLSGIGKTRANQIVEYRESHGKFKTIDDIKQVPGIKEAVFSKIKDYIMV
ncbi:DNA uptake protein and related DNA-binding protein [Lachnospiraceae bacterium TWA4]|nr:DNA uptake protein and related DNA-binding protein [Lachnospiraceae bacterium TWA4]